VNCYKVLAINPGSTSTKIGVYCDEVEVFKASIEHSSQELSLYPTVIEQYEMRKRAILQALNKEGIQLSELSGIVARGGTLPPIKGGAYRVTEKMIATIRSGKIPEHASNVAAIIAHEIAAEWGIPAMIYDGVSTDELDDIARISGMPAIPRASLSHALNTKAVARKVAQRRNQTYQEVNVIVAHLGGGISISLHKKGQMVDIVSDDEGPFSPERAGRVPCRALIELCYSGKHDLPTLRKMLRGKGGFVAYLGTNSAIEVEERIKSGDTEAELIYRALAYQVAKGIGELATVVAGDVDGVALTGGLAHSQLLTGWIKDNVSFIAPVEIYPGENELASLASGCVRVLRGDEQVNEY
jgi:butyrate kinase